MLTLSAKIRKEVGKKVKNLREKGILPAVLYGPKVKNQPLEVDLKEFEKIRKEAGENTLISLELQGVKEKYLVLIHEPVADPITGVPTHVDFYQPSLEEKIEANIPIVLEGEALAVKDFGGTLIKNISEVRVKAFPQNLPKEIVINIGNLNVLEDRILVKDLKVLEGVEILKGQNEIVVSVAAPEKVEEELAKPVEEKVEEVKVVEKEKKPADAEAMAGKGEGVPAKSAAGGKEKK
ncbi:MAG: 50S ribosomal protein L25 [Candidatus Nealsonbacteria bacterium]|nr:50S ribosomal protein L25 [Candidatus Nealsonbacteria bacterium]